MTSVSEFPARIVVTAQRDGRSHVASDSVATTRAETATFSVADIWAAETVPTSVTATDALTGEVVLEPPRGGVLVRVVAFPPDSEWAGTDAYGDALSGIGASHDDDGESGMHTTDTVDVITVLSGQIVSVLDDDEVVLSAGDSLVQRGTRHAWSNRTDSPAVITATMISAGRSE